MFPSTARALIISLLMFSVVPLLVSTNGQESLTANDQQITTPLTTLYQTSTTFATLSFDHVPSSYDAKSSTFTLPAPSRIAEWACANESFSFKGVSGQKIHIYFNSGHVAQRVDFYITDDIRMRNIAQQACIPPKSNIQLAAIGVTQYAAEWSVSRNGTYYFVFINQATYSHADVVLWFAASLEGNPQYVTYAKTNYIIFTNTSTVTTTRNSRSPQPTTYTTIIVTTTVTTLTPNIGTLPLSTLDAYIIFAAVAVTAAFILAILRHLRE